MKIIGNITDENPRVPAPEVPFRHKMPVQMRFTDIDMLGHVNNNAYLSYMDLAKVNYFSEVLPEGMDWRHVSSVIVHIDCDYYSPAYFEEPLVVLTTIVSVSARSFRMEQRVINDVTKQTKCISRTTMAGFDPKTATGRPIDRFWVEHVARYENRQL